MRSTWIYLLCLCVMLGIVFSVSGQDAESEDRYAADAEKVLNRISFGSCLKRSNKGEILSVIADREPDMFIWLGDNIYADTSDPAVMKRRYEKLQANPNFQKLRKQCLNLATWDDHDYGQNNAGAEFKMKKDAQRLFLEFFGEGEGDPRATREGIYHSRIFGPEGKRVQVILLDVRYFRTDPKKGAEEAATVLGEAQWKWLQEQLKKPAELRLVCSGIQVVNDEHKWEHWGHFPKERERLFKLIRDTRAKGVVFLTGDRHYSEICKIENKASYALWDLTSSGLDSGVPEQIMGANRYRVGDGLRVNAKFSELEIDWDQRSMKVLMIDGQGKVHSELALNFSSLGLK